MDLESRRQEKDTNVGMPGNFEARRIKVIGELGDVEIWNHKNVQVAGISVVLGHENVPDHFTCPVIIGCAK